MSRQATLPLLQRTFKNSKDKSPKSVRIYRQKKWSYPIWSLDEAKSDSIARAFHISHAPLLCPLLSSTEAWKQWMSEEMYREFSMNVRNFAIHRSRFVTQLSDFSKSQDDFDKFLNNVEASFDLALFQQAYLTSSIVFIMIQCLHDAFKMSESVMETSSQISNQNRPLSKLSLSFRLSETMTNHDLQSYTIVGMIKDIETRLTTFHELRLRTDERYGKFLQLSDEVDTLESFRYAYIDYFSSWKYFISYSRLLVTMFVQVIDLMAQQVGHLNRATEIEIEEIEDI